MPQPCSWLRTILFHAHGAPGVFVGARLVAVGLGRGVFVGGCRVGVAAGAGTGVLAGHPGDTTHLNPTLPVAISGVPTLG